MQLYGLAEARADRWAGDFPVEAMRNHGITVKPAEKVKSDLYKELLPLLNSGRVELLDLPRLHGQLGRLGAPHRPRREGFD